MSTLDFYNQFNSLTNVLQSFAYNLTNNMEDARDLYQETAHRAIKNKEKFTPGTNFKAWLMTIMKNIFINNYRRKVKQNTIMDYTDNQHYINSGSVTVHNDAGTNIMMDELLKLVKNLDSGLRVPFMMHYKGYKYEEIAQQLELPLGTVKSRIFFARKELKQKIKYLYD